MNDPISFVKGIKGLIKASHDLTKVLTNFTGSMKTAPAQATIALDEINETRSILEEVQNFILGFETADKSRTALIQVNQLVNVITGCVATFSEFGAALDRIASSHTTHKGHASCATWDAEKMAGLVTKLGKHKCSLSLLMTILAGYFWLSLSGSFS
jgi:hypothetical protein